MTERSSDSISNTISKLSSIENDPVKTVPPVIERPITNEMIRRGDRILDTYTVVSDAINGGMGSVWKVHHDSWDTDLAMKRPQPKYFAEGSAKRKAEFIRECEAWIGLGLHPNTVSCYYVREIGGVPTVFSEWMENGSLGDRIRDGSLYEGSEDEVSERLLDIAVQFAEGLRYAHESEEHLVHQDVKPDNVLLTKEWDAKVSDFGLARARKSLQDDRDESSPDHFVQRSGYTPAYCSSEQYEGRPLSIRTDIYSWAVSVLEMYLGKRQWKNGTEAGRNCAEYYDRCCVPMPAGLREVLTQCLAENEEERPQNLAPVIGKLKETYRKTVGVDYLRPKPEAVSSTADALNNRALSWLDLGRPDTAVQVLKDAMEADSGAADPVYNYALLSWRRGDLSDEECIAFLHEHGTDGEEDIYRERGVSEWGHESDGILMETTELHDYDRSPFWELELAALHRSAEPGTFAVQTMNDDFFQFEYSSEKNRWTVRAMDCYRDPSVLIRKGSTEFEWFDFMGDKLYLQKWNEDVACGEEHCPRDLRFVRPHGKIRAVSAADGTVSLYDSSLQKIKDIRADIGDIEDDLCIGTAGDDLFICTFDAVLFIDTGSEEIRTVFHTEGNDCIADAELQGDRLYVLTDSAIAVLDTGGFETEKIRLHGQAESAFTVMAGGEHIVTAETSDPVYHDDTTCILRVYSVRQKRCVLTERFPEFEDFTENETFRRDNGPFLFATGDDTFSLVFSAKSRSRERRSSLMNYRGGRIFGSHFLFVENFRIPEPGDKCEWRLSKARSTKENIETARLFESQLQKARSAFEDKDIHTCMEYLEACYAMQGFRENDRLRRLNRTAGQGRKIQSVRYIRPYEEAAGLQQAEEKHLVSTDQMLIRTGSEGSVRYELRNWETGELLQEYPAEEDTVFACIASSQCAAYAIESIAEDCFILHRMDLKEGTSSRRRICASINRDGITAASDGRRVLIDSGRRMRIAVSEDAGPRITFGSNTDRTGLYSPVFTGDGRYVCTSAGFAGRDHGDGLLIYPADSFFTAETGQESTWSSPGIFEQITVNEDGTVAAALSGHHLPFVFCPDKERKEMFRAQCGHTSQYVFFIPGGSGIIALGEDGSAGLFMPRSREDYVLYAREKGNEMPPEGFRYDPVPQQYVRYTAAGPVLTKDAPLEDSFVRLKMTQKITPAAEMTTGPGMSANSDGTAFLDASAGLWVIDYVYAEEEEDGFLTWGRTVKGKDPAKDNRPEKKGLFARLFKGRS
ncbi:MAG: protein kinase [Solobacterium sp.]|nr:protein kinase [Solobacterium sp.]